MPPTNTSLLLFSVALFSALTAHYVVDAHIVFFTVGTQKFIVQLVENAFFALLFVTAHTANFLVNFDVVKSATWTFFVFQRKLQHYYHTMKRDRLVLHLPVAQVKKLHKFQCHRQKFSTDFFVAKRKREIIRQLRQIF